MDNLVEDVAVPEGSIGQKDTTTQEDVSSLNSEPEQRLNDLDFDKNMVLIQTMKYVI